MKSEEIQAIISSLMDYLYAGELAIRGEFSGVTLTQEQIDELKNRCITVKNKAIDLHKGLVPDVFDLELPATSDEMTPKPVDVVEGAVEGVINE